MDKLIQMLGVFSIADVFVWSSIAFLVTLGVLVIISLRNRVPRREILHGLPEDERW